MDHRLAYLPGRALIGWLIYLGGRADTTPEKGGLTKEDCETRRTLQELRLS